MRGATGDENAPPKLWPPQQQEPVVTIDPMARITDSFRATKAQIACKRPREVIHTPFSSPRNRGCCNTPLRSSPCPRVPLSELRANPWTPSVAHCSMGTLEYDINAVEADTLSSETFLLSPRVSDEEFDEAILKEIDAICEQRSSAKRERPSPFHSLASSQTSTSTGDEKPPDNGKVFDSSRVQKVEEEMANSAQCKYMESLNDKQREAACSDISVPLMIVAGPGSGKTSTMVGRVLTLLKEGICAANILAMTFTTAAASEMRERIAKVTGKATAKDLLISTFHSFCLQLCRSHAENRLNRTPEFLIYGHGQQRRAVIESLRVLENEKHDSGNNCSNMDAASFKEAAKKWQKFVTQAKASGRTPEDCQRRGNDTGAKILQNYENILSSCNALDYHDFISCSVRLLTEFPEVYKSCQDQWKAIIVDEFQDTSSMQYSLLRILGSHNRVTVIGDEDQSIFSFNGADICGFDSFRGDFPAYKEVRLCKNYRSTRCIVEAASYLIRNNIKRCQQKQVVTENSSGCKIVVKECYTEDAQCAFVIDKILELSSDRSNLKHSFNNIAILYRRQVTGRLFQMAFRDRKIPFNSHGVAFYRKKVVKAIIAILRTTLPGCGDSPFRQAFKALLLCEKEVKKKIIEYIDKISSARNCTFISAASDIFSAKISGTFKRAQLTQGRKVLSDLGILSKLVCQESSISSVISSAANLLPQRYLFEERAIIDVDGGKYLNEDHDLRSVLQYLLDDLGEFHSSYSDLDKHNKHAIKENGCQNVLGAFLDHISLRETEHFRALRCENQDSVTLTTIHQSKGLEWDTVFIVKANESEIPLSNEFSCSNEECGTSIEEERRLMYVAMTRARKKLYILYVLMDSYRMLLHPSRFLREIPVHLTEGKEDANEGNLPLVCIEDRTEHTGGPSKCHSVIEVTGDPSLHIQLPEEISYDMKESTDILLGNNFLKRFNVEDRSTISQLFHTWARKQAFQIPKRLMDKVGFVIDERLRSKTSKNKDLWEGLLKEAKVDILMRASISSHLLVHCVINLFSLSANTRAYFQDLLRSLKASLSDEEAIHYAQYVLRWEKIPSEKRAHLTREKQEHFLKQRIEASMSSSAPSAKQVSYLQSLGCTIVPTSRLHASRLIEQYKSL